MSPPLLRLDGPSKGNSSASLHCVTPNGSELKECNYLGLSGISSVDSSAASNTPEGYKSNLNLKATELRLGLPGSQSPERESDSVLLSQAKLDEKQLFPLIPSKDGICSASQKTVVSGSKRGSRTRNLNVQFLVKETGWLMQQVLTPDMQNYLVKLEFV